MAKSADLPTIRAAERTIAFRIRAGLRAEVLGIEFA
jgi:hypothetical protein